MSKAVFVLSLAGIVYTSGFCEDRSPLLLLAIVGAVVSATAIGRERP
jgi:hypothetical protein